MTFCLFSGAMIDCLSFEKRGSRSGHLYVAFVGVHYNCGCGSQDLVTYWICSCTWIEPMVAVVIVEAVAVVEGL
jgi:hypothetical protein